MFSEDFFILNANTHFSFPHHNCDEIPTVELSHMFFHPDYFCGHIVRHFGAKSEDIIHRLQAHPTLAAIGTAFMRLKFLVEVLDPRQLHRRVTTQKKAGGFLKGEMLAIWDWEHKGTERYAAVDVLANHMCHAMIEIIRDIVGNKEVREFQSLATIAATLNEEIPKIRAGKCEQYVWSSEAPYHFVNYPYFMFVVRVWAVLEKLGGVAPP